MIRFTGLFVLLILVLSAEAQVVVRGMVIDGETEQPLAFVHVKEVGTRTGTVSSIEGRFRLRVSSADARLEFSYVGYEPKTVPATDKPLTIKLYESEAALSEITVTPTANPAHRIIRRAVANRKRNDPQELAGFSYESYNKFTFTPEVPPETYQELRDDTTLTDSARRERIKSYKRIKKKHFFISEAITEKHFSQPDENREVVRATRVSGFEQPEFAILGTNTQPFGFYETHLQLLGVNYRNPISKGSISKYAFTLKDTLYDGSDSIFVISFEPREGKLFNSLKGVLYIHTRGYAIRNVIAEPAGRTLLKLSIQQQFTYTESGHWFPYNLNYNVKMYDYPRNGLNSKLTIIAYLDNIRIGDPDDSVDFDEYTMLISDSAYDRTDSFWAGYRNKPLTVKDIESFRFVDSFGEAYNLDRKARVLEEITTGHWPLKYVDISLSDIVRVNGFEGWRLGAGLYTNDDVSRWFSVGGYYGYGFDDKRSKYGGSLQIFLSRDKEYNLKFAYSNDLVLPADHYFFNNNLTFGQSYRRVYADRMDYNESYRASAGFRLFRYLTGEVVFNRQARELTYDYDYDLADETADAPVLTNTFNLTEATLKLRYAYGERYTKTPRRKYALGTDYPILQLNITRGIDGLTDGNYDYWRLAATLRASDVWRGLGEPSIVINAGRVEGEALPYSLFFNGKSAGAPDQAAIYIPEHFQTSQLFEFTNSRYVYIFYSHRFGNILYNIPESAPELSIVHNAGIGDFFGQTTDLYRHRGIELRSMRHGLFEAGLTLDQLYRSEYYNLFYIGLGTSLFYRYGAYNTGEFSDNFVWKISTSIAFR